MKLYNYAVEYLASFGRNNKEQQNIVTKFNNISGKTARYNVPEELFLKRVHRKNRALIPYRTVIKNRLTKNHLELFENGVTVEFVNNDYFENSEDELTKWLKSILGSDNNVSSIITIKSEGDSSSNAQREAYKKLIDMFGENGVKDNLIRRDDNYSGSKGNENWKGYIYYSIKGGQQDKLLSHKQNINLFNPAVEYASSKVATHINYVLIYFALHSIPENTERNNMIYAVANELCSAEYDFGNLYDYCNHHISLTLEKNKLMDPIQATEIKI